MAVKLMCPNLRCRKILAVPNDSRGGRVRCFYCGMILAVPWADGTLPSDSVAVKKGSSWKKRRG